MSSPVHIQEQTMELAPVHAQVINFQSRGMGENLMECMGRYGDGSHNIEYGLVSLRRRLIEDVGVIERLLEWKEDVQAVYEGAGGEVGVVSDNVTALSALVDDGVVRVEGEQKALDVVDDGETHYYRKKKIMNLANVSDTCINESPSAVVGPFDWLRDKKNERLAFNRYLGLIKPFKVVEVIEEAW